MDDIAYLGRTLTARTNDTASEIAIAVQTVMRQYTAKGQTGAAVIHIDTEALNLLRSKVTEACQFAFNLTGSTGPDVMGQLTFFAGRVETVISDEIRSKLGNLGIPQHVAASEFAKLQGKLQSMRARLLDDYSHGMMRNNQLKKEPVVNVVQSNSPGAVQQIGVGQVSQSAIIDNRQALVQAIEQALTSKEFAALTSEQKVEFTDLADALRDEARKDKPDAGKLERWGGKLLAFSTDIGMKVASGIITQVLTKMIVGV